MTAASVGELAAIGAVWLFSAAFMVLLFRDRS